MVKKLSNVKIAASTLEIVEAGYYKSNAGVNITIRKQVEAAVNSSKMYTPQECEDLKKNTAYSLNKGNVTEFFVWNCTTLEAAERLTNENENVAALNFASAKFPGGGFKTGAKAQEESLARSSALYHCLKKHPKFYSNNKRENNYDSTHIVLGFNLLPLTLKGEFNCFWRDNGDLLQTGSYLLSILSAPAIHYGNAHKRLKKTTVLEDRMAQRAHYILSIAAHHGHEVLILGAWGCGVFKFPVDECAGDEAPFQYTFKKVVFAILKPQQVEAFEDFFCDDEDEEEEAEAGEGESTGEKGKEKEVPQVKVRKEIKRREKGEQADGGEDEEDGEDGEGEEEEDQQAEDDE